MGKRKGSLASKADSSPNKETTRPPKPEVLAKHKVESGETLSGIALKYYKSAAREKWMAIYEANKEMIGDNPGLIKPGQVLQIPALD